MSCASMAGDSDHARLVEAVFEVTSRVWIQERHLQTQKMSSLRARSAKQTKRLGAEGKVEIGNRRNGFSSNSASEKSAEERTSGGKLRERKLTESRHEEVQGDGSKKTGCREPEMALIFAKIVRSLPNFDSTGRVGDSKANSSENVLVTVIEMTSSTKLQEDVAAKWNKHATTTGCAKNL